ncbi:MAG: phage head-tail connector protein [Sphaerochaetaceae bacterium]
MTIADEDRSVLTILVNDSTISTTEVLDTYLTQAGYKIINKRYPFATGAEKTTLDIPEEYKPLWYELSATLIAKRGAEGESSHNENGVSRSYRDEATILADIISLGEFYVL